MKSIAATLLTMNRLLQSPTKTLILNVIASALILGGNSSFVLQAQSTIKQIAPDALIANLYRQAGAGVYVDGRKGAAGSTNRVFQPRSRALLDKYFEKSLADLIWKALLRWESSGTSDIEDFDYVLFNFGYGEGTITKFAIGKPGYQRKVAQVTVSYDVVCMPPACAEKSVDRDTIIFLMTAGGTGWRITDVKYDGGKTSLFEMYSMDSKATAAEFEYWRLKRTALDAQLNPDLQGYTDYLQAYPNGAYADVARIKLQAIETGPSPLRNPPTNAAAQPYTRVSFKKVKDLYGLVKTFPFLKGSIDDLISNNKYPARGRSRVYVSDLDPNGQTRLLLVAFDGSLYCGSHGCSLSVYMDQGMGFRNVLDALAGDGSPVYISTDQLSLLTCGPRGRVEWRFKNSVFEPTSGEPRTSQKLDPCNTRY
jgi:hypothetical protein